MGDRIGFVLKRLLFWCLCLCLLGWIPGQALAQDDEFVLEEIVVTGSRIVRNNQESSSPIVNVDEQLLDQSATASIETQLNKLPQFAPTIDVPTTGGDIQPTARNTPGEATVALRGIGANRTLVLLNGRRGTPSNGMGVLDINTIPTAAIEYVEAISGGASSVYGADAMAGVLNFIMKDNFNGFELDFQTGVTEEGDNFEYQVSGVLGTDFAEDRGNVMLAFSFNKRESAQWKDRDWYVDNWKDPSISGTQFFINNSGAQFASPVNRPDVDVVNSLLGLSPGFTSSPAQFYVAPNGQVFTGYDSGTEAGVQSAIDAGVVDGYNVILQNNGRLGQNNTDYYLIFPLERYNLFTQGDYEVNDWISVFGSAYFSKVKTHTKQEPGPLTGGWDINIYPEYNRDVIPDELLALIDSRPDPTAPFMIRGMLPVNRQTITETETFGITAGVEGRIPGIDWTWELYTSHGEAQTYAQSVGYVSMERIRSFMSGIAGYNEDGTPYFYDGYKNFGQGLVIKGNQHSNSPGFGAATASCTSGLNPFDWSTMTDDCWNAIKADVKTRMLVEQDIVEFNAQGPIVELPAGELRAAVGLTNRKNMFKFLSDNVNSEGQSFNDQILGLYPAQDSLGSIEVREAYAELLIPVLRDLPFVRQLDLELGGRESDYDTTGSSETYKVAFDWRTNDWLRIRGTYNRAERAPNIAELYLAPEQSFGMTSYGDVCSMRNRRDYSASPDYNGNWYEVVKLCGQKMDMVGQDLDIDFYGAEWQEIYDYAVANGGAVTPEIDETELNDQPAGGAGFLWPLNIGNDELQPEVADTYTVGVVIDSPFQNPWLSNIRLSVDYYMIEINDAIGNQSADIVMYQCVDPSFNPTFDPNSPYCSGFHRDSRFGSLGVVEKSFFNSGRFETSGLDISLNWSADLGPGRLSLNSLINYLMDKSSRELPTRPMVDFTGTLGPSENGLNGNSYEWRALTNVTYAWGDIDLTLRWQYWDSIEQAAAATGSTSQKGAPSYSLFDLVGSYQLLDNLRLRFGIENVFGKEPPIVGRNPSDASGMYGGSFSAQNYDTVGRRFYLGARINF
jgi:iron complex outermembrane recepter protein